MGVSRKTSCVIIHKNLKGLRVVLIYLEIPDTLEILQFFGITSLTFRSWVQLVKIGYKYFFLSESNRENGDSLNSHRWENR